jgi:hypothetical protein
MSGKTSPEPFGNSLQASSRRLSVDTPESAHLHRTSGATLVANRPRGRRASNPRPSADYRCPGKSSRLPGSAARSRRPRGESATRGAGVQEVVEPRGSSLPHGRVREGPVLQLHLRSQKTLRKSRPYYPLHLVMAWFLLRRCVLASDASTSGRPSVLATRPRHRQMFGRSDRPTKARRLRDPRGHTNRS